MNSHYKFRYIVWLAILCINCTNNHKDISQRNDMIYKNELQLLSSLMFIQFNSEGCQLNFDNVSSDSLEFLRACLNFNEIKS
jgi:hypothetical protein